MKIHCEWIQESVRLLPRKGYLESFFQVAESRVRRGAGGLDKPQRVCWRGPKWDM